MHKGKLIIKSNTREGNFFRRYGSTEDTACLQSLFQQLGFTVFVAQNLTRNETLIKIIEFSDSVAHSDANMAIVCISSHGRCGVNKMISVRNLISMILTTNSCVFSDSGKIISSDCRELDLEQDILRWSEFSMFENIEKISRRFNNEYCPKLKGKPKFFIIQVSKDTFD